MREDIKLVILEDGFHTGRFELSKRFSNYDYVIFDNLRLESAKRLARAIGQAFLESREGVDDPFCELDTNAEKCCQKVR